MKVLHQEDILRAVASLHGMSRDEVLKPEDSYGFLRQRRVRAATIWCVRELTKHSFSEIATFFGYSSHRSAMLAYERHRMDSGPAARTRLLLDVIWWPQKYVPISRGEDLAARSGKAKGDENEHLKEQKEVTK